jgi:diaminopimelate epimerase
MSTLPFTKVEGLGNDFLVVDLRARAGSGEAAAVQNPEFVRRVCDRHFGVGGDGVLAILPTLPGVEGDARMRVLNADGSEAEMCGNGIRCVAKVLYESDPALRRRVLKIDTGAGLLACELTATDGRVDSVTVEMGRPRLTRDELPLTPGGAGRAVREAITSEGRTFHFTAVSMGNPHAVIFVDDPAEDLMALAKRFGPALEVAPAFPRRTNVEFARVRQAGDAAQIDLVVWERGCGITLACGTGACATAVAAAVEERLPRGREILVHLPGGPLAITVAPDDSGVRMRGPAHTVFRSELEL